MAFVHSPSADDRKWNERPTTEYPPGWGQRQNQLLLSGTVPDGGTSEFSFDLLAEAGASISLIGVWATIKRDENREKETSKREENLSILRAILEKQKLEFANNLERHLAELRSGLETVSRRSRRTQSTSA